VRELTSATQSSSASSAEIRFAKLCESTARHLVSRRDDEVALLRSGLQDDGSLIRRLSCVEPAAIFPLA